MRLLSLFSGCGGMDLGFEGGFSVHAESMNPQVHNECWYTESNDGKVKLEQTAFETVFSNDILPYAESAWKTFFKSRGTDVDKVFHNESVVDLVKKALDENDPFSFPNDIDVVTGGFPCQDFSVAGKRKGFKSHKTHKNKIEEDIPSEETRGQLYLWMKQVIELTQPKVFLAENVKGLVSLDDVKQVIENDFRNIGEGYYVVEAQVLNAAHYGVPQNRERVIFIGLNRQYLREGAIEAIENGDIALYPPISHSANPENHQKSYIQSSRVLIDLEEPDSSNDRAQQGYSKAKYRPGTQGQTEVNPDGLAPTIRAEHHGNIEYRRLSRDKGGQWVDELDNGKAERRLTVRECARIQSFPDEYPFVFTKKETGGAYSLSASGAYKVIGNAVPPLMAFNLAKNLESIWGDLFTN
ncbi:DNA cytosine methyltransferase [Vibrio sp. 10N.222.55.E8]|uniref:DNA cytosine methyltransferase n=1 Tax=Vibrio artabrorum TaxID=446374 RepID=UPI00354E8BF5